MKEDLINIIEKYCPNAIVTDSQREKLVVAIIEYIEKGDYIYHIGLYVLFFLGITIGIVFSYLVIK